MNNPKTTAECTNPELAEQALNALEFAEQVGVGVFARQTSEFAPGYERELDTVVVVLRGQAARDGRAALVAVADLVGNRS